MPFPIVLAALAAYSAYQKNELANKQKREADALSHIKRPPFEIPDAAKQALQIAKYRALATTLPGQPLMEQKIGAATAGGLRYATETAGSPVDALATGSAMIGNEQNQLGDLAIKGAENQNQNIQNLTGQLGAFASWQNQASEWNKYQPYTQAKQAESALRYGSEANKYGATQDLLGAAAAGYYGMGQNDTGGGNKTPIQPNNTNTTLDMSQKNVPIQGLNTQQKMEQFKIKNGRYPYSWELSSL